MRPDSNQIAMRAVRAILEAGHPFDVDIAGTRVSCEVARGAAVAWPERGIRGLDEEKDGPWPVSLEVTCRWDQGQCALLITCASARSKKRRDNVGIAIRLKTPRRLLVWTEIERIVKTAVDGHVSPADVSMSLAKRHAFVAADHQKRLNSALAELAASSGLPLISRSRVKPFEVHVPTGTVTPSPNDALERLVRLALLKLDFMDRGPKAEARGTKLVDVA